MHPCNRGEMLTRSVQENAANRTAATRARRRVVERPELFIGLGACDNSRAYASSFPGIARQSSRRKLRATSRTTFSKVRGEAPRTARQARALPRSSCIETNVNLRLSHLVQFSFGAQHHDWPGTFLLLRVRGPFLPISCSRNMGPDPMERDSNGDVQNDASTRESCRSQTAVLSP